MTTNNSKKVARRSSSRATRKCACGNPTRSKWLACSDCNSDFKYRLRGFKINPFFDLDAFIQRVQTKGIGPVGQCIICGGNYTFGGQNPSPVAKDDGAKCCGYCNDYVVTPKHLKKFILPI